MTTITRVTKKGQATIPKALRIKFGIKDRVLVSATEEGVLFKPPPSPASDFGSLGTLFPGKTSKEVLEDARSPDSERDKKLSI
jgi:AbrB family looped-hinge helix DNA binding protein